MKTIKQLSALAHEHRLAIFRLLVRTGKAGMHAGDIAQQLQLPTSSLSGYLATLEQASLLIATRDGRFISYRVDADSMRGLLDYLISDCCAGQPELCGLMGTSVTDNKVCTA